MRFPVLVSSLLALSLAGCASVKSTEAFYIASTTQAFPPKPKDYPIPILDKMPKQGMESIGRLAFTSEEGFSFIRRSMEHNARRVGADAVYLKKVESQRVRSPYYVPAQTTWMRVPSYRRATVWDGSRRKGHRHRNVVVEDVTSIPVYRPGYWTEDIRTYTTIDSEMLRYKK